MIVLVVDDSPTQRARWLYSLSNANTTVISEEQAVPPRSDGRVTNIVKLVTAKNGEHALARLRTMKVNVLVCDIEMPGMNGWQLAAAAQQMNRELVAVIFSSKVTTGQPSPVMLDPARTHIISKDDREQAVGIVQAMLA